MRRGHDARAGCQAPEERKSMTKTLHYVTPVDYGDFEPAPHYETTPWVQPMTSGLIDTRDIHAQSEPVTVELPDGTTITESPQGLIATRPDGA